MVRWGLLKADTSLATRFTKSTMTCDRALLRLMCYINCTTSATLAGYTGDPPKHHTLRLYADADFARARTRTDRLPVHSWPWPGRRRSCLSPLRLLHTPACPYQRLRRRSQPLPSAVSTLRQPMLASNPQTGARRCPRSRSCQERHVEACILKQNKKFI